MPKSICASDVLFVAPFDKGFQSIARKLAVRGAKSLTYLELGSDLYADFVLAAIFCINDCSPAFHYSVLVTLAHAVVHCASDFL